MPLLHRYYMTESARRYVITLTISFTGTMEVSMPLIIYLHIAFLMISISLNSLFTLQSMC